MSENVQPDWLKKYIIIVEQLKLDDNYKVIGKGKVVDFAFLLNIKEKGETKTTWIKRAIPNESFESLIRRVDDLKVKLARENVNAIETLMAVVKPKDEKLFALCFQDNTLSAMVDKNSFPEINSEVDIYALKRWDEYNMRPQALFKI